MSEDNLKILQEMGFDLEDCKEALEESNNDLEKAIDYLQDDSEDEPRYKLVFLVRTDLGMGTGKIAAQVGHAAIGAYQQCSQGVRDKWEECGTAKIVLQVSSLEQMQTLEACAKAVGLQTYVVQDAGRTQIEAGSVTVCAIGPDDENKINQVTGSLKLFR
jgi:PTH2 family peptidyl-tRNA hydrolase